MSAPPQKTAGRAAGHAGAVPQGRRAAAGGIARAARAAHRPRRAVLLPARLPGPHRPTRDRRAAKRASCRAVRGVVEDVELRSTGLGRLRCWACSVRCARRTTCGPSGSTSRSCASKFAVGQQVLLSGKPTARGACLGDGPSARRHAGSTSEDEPVGKASARLSADRRPAAVADAADRPRRAGDVRRRARRGLSRRVSGRAHDLWPLRQALAADPLSRRPREPGAGPAAVRLSGAVRPATGAGRASGSSSTISGRPRRWRPRPRSTPASAGCFPSS